MIKRIWNYKTRRYTGLYTSSGIELENEYSLITDKDIIPFLMKSSGIRLINSFNKKRLILPRNTNAIVGAVVDYIRKYNSRVIAYVVLFIKINRYRMEIGDILYTSNKNLYLTKNLFETYIHYFDNDVKIALPVHFRVTEKDIFLFESRYKKHHELSKYFTYDIELCSEENDWYNIPPEYLFVLQNHCFDLRWLVLLFEAQFNATKNGAPLPKYPHNPMTRVNLTFEHLSQLQYILKTYINTQFIPYTVKYFIENPEIWGTNSPYSLIEFFEREYRFQKTDVTDSQENYTGRWVNKYEPLSFFELEYDTIMQNNLVHSLALSSEEAEEIEYENRMLRLIGYWNNFH
jgi:hypothetical protein